MKFILVGLGTLVLFASVASQAAGNGSASPAVVADNFVDALKHHRFKDAAAMFAPEAVQDTGATERTLTRVDESLGGFSTICPVATLPDGKSVKLEVPMPKIFRSRPRDFFKYGTLLLLAMDNQCFTN